MALKLNNLSYEEIKIGEVFRFKSFVDEAAVKKFSDLSQDQSPLHADAEYARSSDYPDKIAQGMLLASFFSALVGMLCPGKKALYLSQSLNFRNFLPINREVTVEGTVINKSESAAIIELDTKIKDQTGKVLVDGTARVKVRKI